MSYTPSQTAGPFLSIGTGWDATGRLVPDSDPGAISIVGWVRDGLGEPVTDAVLEFWQADRELFGRALTDGDGRYQIVTIKPEAGDGGSPHLDVSLFARGLMQRVVTRIYFSDEGAANVHDPVLLSMGTLTERRTLVAHPGTGAGAYRFDIHLQGPEETVFFEPWPR